MPPDTAHLLLITCEHGGNDVPPPYQHLFVSASDILDTHRGYDIGALPVALSIAASLAAPIVFSTTTRLLVDLNRSLDQPDLFSSFTRQLPESERAEIVDRHYLPHRSSVERLVAAAIATDTTVVHLGVHSCVDSLDGRDRDLDIALLFDETRHREAAWCEQLRQSLVASDPSLRYPFNTPYRGADDGLTTTLRQTHLADRYLGIEIELRQGLVAGEAGQRAASQVLTEAIRQTLTRVSP